MATMAVVATTEMARDGRRYGSGYGPGYSNGGYAVAPVATEEEAPAASGEETVAYCQQRYRSYDVGSGTYVGYDGFRHPCP